MESALRFQSTSQRLIPAQFELKLDIEKPAWNGTVNFEFRGPILYLKGNF